MYENSSLQSDKKQISEFLGRNLSRLSSILSSSSSSSSNGGGGNVIMGVGEASIPTSQKRWAKIKRWWFLQQLSSYRMFCFTDMTYTVKTKISHIYDGMKNNGKDALVWLRGPPRIEFKLFVLTYKLLSNQAPRYLGSLVCVADLPGQRALCTANTSRLLVPTVRL